MIKHGYKRYVVLFELSCILHIGTLLLFMVRDYFFQVEGSGCGSGSGCFSYMEANGAHINFLVTGILRNILE